MTILNGDLRPKEGPGGLAIIPREPFCAAYWHYKPGEHVVFGGPSTKGKTRLAFDLLQYTVYPDLPAYVAQSKPTDRESDRGAKRLHFRIVRDWPPPPQLKELWGEKPNGYLVQPAFGDIRTDMERCAGITARLLADRYSAGAKGKKGVLVMDDTMVKARIMGLDGQMVTILAMAGAMGLGEWIFVQRPADSGRTALWGYENGIHFFLTKGGDAKQLQRYAEIGGENGPIIKEVIPQLKEYQFLYFQRYEGWICIVDRGEGG